MKKILIAEDEPKLREMLAELLTEEGYQVSTAADGEEAVELLARESPDLLLLDIKMPNMTGLDVMNALRQTKPKLPIIVSSAYSKMASDMTVLTSNVKAYLVKPVDVDELLEAVEKAIAEAE